jgi:hypothetical protein
MSQLVNVQLSPPGDRRTSRMLLPIVGAIVGAVLLIAVGIILLQQTATENDPGLLFEIPAGASANVPAGLLSAVDIPREIIFRDGDTAKITVINHDSVTHLAGPFVVAPGETYVQSFPNRGIFPINCAVNPEESIVVKVE